LRIGNGILIVIRMMVLLLRCEMIVLNNGQNLWL
jgi:hypothetical protein